MYMIMNDYVYMCDIYFFNMLLIEIYRLDVYL